MLQKEYEMHIQALENQLAENEKRMQEALDEIEQMKLNFAKLLKQKGCPIEEIIEYTQLSIEQINQI